MMTIVARGSEQGADIPAKGWTGRHYLLSFVLLIVLLYLFVVVLAKYNQSVRRIAEFLGFKLTFREKPPSSPPSVGSEEGPRKPGT
ncbi:MAG TPA: hypothetical protein VG457_14725 [Planctomycetota bacterium]|jgi:hypothetical protein|nr:hypothetical protein [Planctomycetota bacterium]